MYIKTDADKLKIVLEELNIDPHRLTLTLDYHTPSIIYNILKEKQDMDNDFIEFFVKKYPQVNYLFLLEGRGKPLLSVSEAISQKSILGFSNTEKIDKNQPIDSQLNVIEKRLNVVEKMLLKQNENSNIEKEN